MHHGAIGYVSNAVNADGTSGIVVAIRGRGLLEILERLYSADDGATLIANGDRAHADRDFTTGFVMNEAAGLNRLRGLHRSSKRAFLTAELASRLVAVQQRLRDTGAANHFMAQMAGNAFGSVTPNEDSLLQVDHAQTNGQALKNAETDSGFISKAHDCI
jgi:hypothetical protein